MVVVNDSTLDSSARIAREFARHDSRLRVIDHDVNMGLGAARNTGLSAAQGDYVTFPDSDDIVAAGAYARMVESLDESGSDFATGPAQEFGAKRKRYWTTDTPVFDADRKAVDIATYPDLIEDHTAWNKVFRRSFLVDNDITWPVGVKCEDVVPSVRAYTLASAVDVFCDVIYLYRRRRDSITTALGSTIAFSNWVDQSYEALQAAVKSPSVVRTRLARKILVREYLVSVRLAAVPSAQPSVQQTLRELAELACRYLTSAEVAGLSAADRLRIGLTAGGEFAELERWCDRSVRRRVDDLEAATNSVPVAFRRLLGIGVVDFFERGNGEREELGGDGGRPGAAVPREPELSVIVPTYNVSEYLDETLRSILSARNVDLEVIVVDDWSTDDTREIATRHAEKDRRVRVVRSVGKGGGQARNLGVELARGRYLAFADGDDIVPPNAYWKMLRAARSSDAELVTAKHLRIYASSTWDPGDQLYPLVGTLTGANVQEYISLIHPRTVWNRVFLREFWNSSVAPFCGVPRANDIVPFTSAILHAKRVAFVPVFSYLYRARPGRGSMTAKLGDPSSIVSYMTEELTCSRMVMASSHPDLIRKYWHTVLTEDGWGNLNKYLAAQTERSFDDVTVYPWVKRLLEEAPVDAYREMTPEQQVVWALVAKGDTRTAQGVLQLMRNPASLALEDVLQIVGLSVRNSALSGKTLDHILWKYLVRRLIDDRRSLTLDQAQVAVEVFMASGRARRFTTIPGTYEDQVVRAALLGAPEIVLALDAPTPRHESITANISGDFVHLSGEAAPGATAYRWLFLRGHPKGGHVVRIPVALMRHEEHGGRWEAQVPRESLKVLGKWELWCAYEDSGGIRTSPTQLTVEDKILLDGGNALTEAPIWSLRRSMKASEWQKVVVALESRAADGSASADELALLARAYRKLERYTDAASALRAAKGVGAYDRALHRQYRRAVVRAAYHRSFLRAVPLPGKLSRALR